MQEIYMGKQKMQEINNAKMQEINTMARKIWQEKYARKKYS